MPPPGGEGPAELLLRKAGDDLTVVEKMVDGKGYPVEIIGFHAQQCCEKAFKSVLSRGGIRHPYTPIFSEIIARPSHRSLTDSTATETISHNFRTDSPGSGRHAATGVERWFPGSAPHSGRAGGPAYY